MSSVHPVIPILNAAAATACATGEVSIVAGSCSAAASCSSGSSCSAGGGAADSNDPEFKLAQEGWVLRTTIGEPRLSEVVDNYRAMGYDVHVEYLAPAPAATTKSTDDDTCTTCFDADPQGQSQRWGSVYVRAGQPQKLNDDLY